MSELVRVRLNGVEKTVGRAFAESNGLTVLDEPTHKGDGTLRATTRTGGRQVKKKTSVAEAAAAKKDKAPTPDASTPEEASA